jgi:hypothetical protein
MLAEFSMLPDFAECKLLFDSFAVATTIRDLLLPLIPSL